MPDEYLMERKSIKMPLSLLKTIFSNANDSPLQMERFESIQSNGVKFPKTSKIDKKPENTEQIEFSFDIALLLHSALWKIPQIPFQYVMDVFRWKLFNGTESMANANDLFWKLAFTEQGIHTPDFVNRHEYFDPGAKFHTVDNTPFTQ